MTFLFKSLPRFKPSEHVLLRHALIAHPSHPFSSALRLMKHHQVAQQKKSRLNAKQIKAFLVPEWDQHGASQREASPGKAANRNSLGLRARPPSYTTAAQDSAFFSESPPRLRHKRKNLNLHFWGACDTSTQLAQVACAVTTVTHRAASWGHGFRHQDEPCCSPFARHGCEIQMYGASGSVRAHNNTLCWRKQSFIPICQCLWIKKGTRLIKLFHLYKIYLEARSKKSVVDKLISFSSGTIMQISKCYILVLVKCWHAYINQESFCQAVLMLFKFKEARPSSRQPYSKCHWPQVILNFFRNIQYFEKTGYQPKYVF